MASLVSFTPLAGVHGETPLSYILQVDEIVILLDCGWDSNFDTSQLEPLKQIASTVNIILISHPDTAHLGGLPYAFKEFNFSEDCKIFATLPTVQMGSMFLYDALESKRSKEGFTLYKEDDIDKVMERIQRTTYYEEIQITGSSSFTITPINAGHMLGGAMWKITKDTDSILYAVDINHKNERHLNGCAGVLENESRKSPPSILITDCLTTLRKDPVKKAENEIVESAIATVQRGGNVLIPVDTAGRVLELLMIFHETWMRDLKNVNSRGRLGVYQLVFLQPVAESTITFAKSSIDWMNSKLSEDIHKDGNPFDFNKTDKSHGTIRICKSLEQLDSLPSLHPKIVFASDESLQTGFAKELLIRWAEDSRNLLLLTSRSTEGTLASNIVNNPSIKTWPIKVYNKVPLVGKELEVYLDAERKINELSNFAMEEDGEDVDESAMEVEAVVDVSRGFGKYKKPQYLMFGFTEITMKFDEYGEFIDKEAFGKMNDLDLLKNQSSNSTLASGESNETVVVEVPTRTTCEDRWLNLNCQIKFVDFEGRSDATSVINYLQKLRPRKVIIVHGTTEAADKMKYLIENTEICDDDSIYTPKIGEKINMSSDTNIYRAVMHDALERSMDLCTIGGYTVAYLDAEINEVVDDESKSSHFVLDPIMGDIPLRNSVFLGLSTIKLADIQASLLRRGVNSGFATKGILVCEGDVTIQKDTEGELLIDGPLGVDFFKIREVVYSNYVQL